MKTLLCVIASIIVVFVSVLTSASQDKIRMLERTYTGPVVNRPEVGRNPTFGYAAEAFIPDCEVWFHGELLDPVPSPYDRAETGIFIKKTATEVTINGRVYSSVYDKPRKSPYPIDPRITRYCRISEVAERQFRQKARRHGELSGAYVVDGTVYRPNVPTPFTLAGGDTTVIITVRPKHMWDTDYVLIEYDGYEVGVPIDLNPGPQPTHGEADEQRLDVNFNSLVGKCQPGWIVVLPGGVYPPRLRSTVRDALAQIPKLAVPTHEDFYGDMMYEWLTINGLTFDSNTIRDFVEASRR